MPFVSVNGEHIEWNQSKTAVCEKLGVHARPKAFCDGESTGVRQLPYIATAGVKINYCLKVRIRIH